MKAYQKWVEANRKYPDLGSFAGLEYCILAMCGEAGETANVLKKLIRDRASQIDNYDRAKLLLELGDVLWYVAAAASELGSSLEEVADLNQTKINGRSIVG